VFTLTPEELDAIKLSLRVSTLAMAASLPFGIAIAMVLTRTRFYGRMLLNALVLFGRQGPIGRFLDEQLGIVLAFRWTGAALACAIMGFPLLVRAIQLSLEAVDRRLEQAASTLGANPLYVFSTVTLPLILPGIVAGGILCFARAMGEFGATITFVSNIPGETQTLPTLIYTFTQVPGGEAGALRLTLISVVISLGAILASEAFVARVQKRNRG
jgi:molybdate transport system permease protein